MCCNHFLVFQWHIEEDLMQTDRWNPNEEFPIPMWKMWVIQISVLLGFAALFVIAENYPVGPPVVSI